MLPEVPVVGKGPTLWPPGPNERRLVCALNGAAVHCPRVDWLFVSDVSAISELDEQTMDRVDNLVIPTELHLRTDGTKTLHWPRTPDWFRFRPEIHLYELNTAKKTHTGAPHFGAIFSVGESCVAWILRLGFREFFTRGIDPAPSYHVEFAGGRQLTEKPTSWYRKNLARISWRISHAGGRLTREEPNGFREPRSILEA